MLTFSASPRTWSDQFGSLANIENETSPTSLPPRSLPAYRLYVHNRRLRQRKASHRLCNHPRPNNHDPSSPRPPARHLKLPRLHRYVQIQYLQSLSPDPHVQHPAPTRHSSRRTRSRTHLCLCEAEYGAEVRYRIRPSRSLYSDWGNEFLGEGYRYCVPLSELHDVGLQPDFYAWRACGYILSVGAE